MSWFCPKLLPLSLVAALLPIGAAAGVTNEAILIGKAQIQYPSSGHPSCGVYLKGIKKDFSDEDKVRVFDVSVMVHSIGGLVKAGVVEAKTESIGTSTFQGTLIKPMAFWVRVVGGKKGKTDMTIGPLPTELEGYLMYGTSRSAALEFVDAVMSGGTVQVAYLLPGDPVETLNYGSVELDPAQAQQLGECFGVLAKSMEGELAAREANEALGQQRR